MAWRIGATAAPKVSSSAWGSGGVLVAPAAATEAGGQGRAAMIPVGGTPPTKFVRPSAGTLEAERQMEGAGRVAQEQDKPDVVILRPEAVSRPRRRRGRRRCRTASSALKNAQSCRILEGCVMYTFLVPPSWPPVRAAAAANKAYNEAVEAEGREHARGSPHVHTAAAFLESLRDVPFEDGGVGGVEADKRPRSSFLSHFQGCDSPQELARCSR